MVRPTARIAPAVLALSSVLAASCGPAAAPPLTEARRAAISDSVRQMAAGLAARISARGYRAVPAVMDSAPGYVWAYNGFLPFTSFDSMAAWARSAPEPAEGGEVFAWDTVRVEAIAPGMAHFAAGYSETAADSAGRPRTERGVITGVVVHRSDGWKFVNAHTSTLPAPADPAAIRQTRRTR